MRRRLLVVLLSIVFVNAIASQREIDSLNTVLNSGIHDTVRVACYQELSFQLRNVDNVKALENANAALQLSGKIGFTKGIIVSHQRIAGVHYTTRNYSEAITSYKKTIDVAKQAKKPGLEANAWTGLGRTYYMQDEYPSALDCFLKALDLYELVNDTKEVASALGNVGLVYSRQKNLPKALEYQLKCLEVEKKNGNLAGVAGTLDHIGTVYKKMHDYGKAIEFYTAALKISDSLRHEQNMGVTLHNLASVYEEQEDYVKALDFYNRSLAIKTKMNNQQGIMATLHNIGVVYSETNRILEALNTLNRSLALANELKSRDYKKYNYYSLSKLYEKAGNLRVALDYRDKYEAIKDSIFNEETTRQVAELQARYETDKKEKEIKLLNQEKQIQEAELIKRNAEVTKKNMQRNFLLTGIGLMLVLSTITFRAYTQKKKANGELSLKNAEIIQQKQTIEEKNRDITDSINYAKRIQSAILPPHDEIARAVKEFFVLYRPKDIVSGDFYFFAETGDKLIFAVADCTGHGVPGAFMSLIGNDILNQLILEKGITTPAELLARLHDGVRTALKQSETNAASNNDGMDIAICSLDRQTNEVQFSGALRNLFVLRKGKQEVFEFKADKQSVGGARSDIRKEFTNHVIPMNSGDSFYMFSDGYADQFGGDSGKKFLSSRFKESLRQVRFLKMKEQEKYLSDTFDKWKGENEQVDDVCVFGVRV